MDGSPGDDHHVYMRVTEHTIVGDQGRPAAELPDRLRRLAGLWSGAEHIVERHQRGVR
jgi:hypothetical protein